MTFTVQVLARQIVVNFQLNHVVLQPDEIPVQELTVFEHWLELLDFVYADFAIFTDVDQVEQEVYVAVLVFPVEVGIFEEINRVSFSNHIYKDVYKFFEVEKEAC